MLQRSLKQNTVVMPHNQSVKKVEVKSSRPQGGAGLDDSLERVLPEPASDFNMSHNDMMTGDETQDDQVKIKSSKAAMAPETIDRNL